MIEIWDQCELFREYYTEAIQYGLEDAFLLEFLRVYEKTNGDIVNACNFAHGRIADARGE